MLVAWQILSSPSVSAEELDPALRDLRLGLGLACMTGFTEQRHLADPFYDHKALLHQILQFWLKDPAVGACRSKDGR